MGLTRDEQQELLALLEEDNARYNRRRFHRLFPDETLVDRTGATIHARDQYPRHLEFFAAGANYMERAFLAANRVGKSVGGAYETTAHLTGLYPHWWEGRRFPHHISAWAAGKSNETTRDIIQKELFGGIVNAGTPQKGFDGTGMVPGDRIGKVTWKQGVADLADTVQVRHEDGEWSELGLKSSAQGRGSFEGTAKHVIWLDEEHPIAVYGECIIRLATTGGIMMITFTPLEGITETVMQFLPGEMQLDTDDDYTEIKPW
ncbi:MAG: terminase family protein [Pseudomonadota bacterium]